ncbi:hypothetical protein NHX12_021098 [Muraenolepis orangiensis]|uniref:OTU domain-containing protein n=1 Tax=Muraenolepis orangiensis TaxID=630683 RepID=A0A9Q0IRZ5_9TELE|nr:hypothetical protein NHX12_021098 [Muraenolepis orangiensis]
MELRDHPMELRDHPMEHRDHPMEHRDHPMELRVSRETLVEDRDPNGPLHSFLGNPGAASSPSGTGSGSETRKRREGGGAEGGESCAGDGGPQCFHGDAGHQGRPCPTLPPSDEDLYGGDEDSGPSSSLTAEGSCSLAPAVDLLSYSQREWRGNTAKSVLIRKGYQQMMEGFCGVRRVRGDNYCALRATLFQVLSQTTQPPDWLHHVAMLPEELDGPEGLLSLWSFPGERQPGDGKRDPTQRLKGYIELLRKTWTAVADCPSALQRQRQCEDVFRGGEEELGLLEALKLLMLGCALELHHRMQQGLDVPVFCWLLFARDSSPCPRTFLTNHLRHVGVSGGLEQVEMFLLGYALRCTIQVYRLYMSGTEEFLTYYPDDHRDDWPCVSLVTEDDRHYNVPVVKETTTAAAQEAASR